MTRIPLLVAFLEGLAIATAHTGHFDVEISGYFERDRCWLEQASRKSAKLEVPARCPNALGIQLPLRM